jgi:hypothetical protein
MKLKKTAVIGTVGVLSIMLLGMGCNRHKRFHGERFQKMVLEKMDDLSEDLNLDSTQKEKYNLIRTGVESDMKKHHKERRAFALKIKGEVDKNEPDIDKIITLVKGKDWDHKSFKNKYADKFLEFYTILDEEQRKIIIKKMKRFSKHFPAE